MTFPNELNDSLDNLFEGDKTVDGAPRVTPPAAFTALKEAGHFEKCHKCGGSGRFRGFGQCFACKGSGGKTFKTSAADRARARTANADRAVRRDNEALEAFAAANPAIWAHLQGSDNDFSRSLIEGIRRFGDLTAGQRAAVERGIEKNAQRKAEASARARSAPQADTAGIERLKEAFDTAIAYSAAKGLKKSPRITVGSVVISPAKATSANPGALYVKEAGTYLGKIAAGKFFASRECTDEQQANVLKFVADPKAASEVYGRETGTCCICSATLTSEWRLRGIGPICAEKFGW